MAFEHISEFAFATRWHDAGVNQLRCVDNSDQNRVHQPSQPTEKVMQLPIYKSKCMEILM